MKEAFNFVEVYSDVTLTLEAYVINFSTPEKEQGTRNSNLFCHRKMGASNSDICN